MTRDLETAGLDAPVDELVRMMHGRGVSAIPIVDADGSLAGIVSRTDLIKLGYRQTGRRWTSPVMPLPKRLARDVMTREPRAVDTTAPLRHAAIQMREHKIHRVVVVDDERRPVGIVSTLELAGAVANARLDLPIAEVMTKLVIAVDARTPLSAAIELLEKVPITGLIVTDEELPIGMFTQLDALASRDLPRGTPVDETFDAGVICMPIETKLHRAAAQVAQLAVRRIVVCKNREPVGVIGGLDFARVIAETRCTA